MKTLTNKTAARVVKLARYTLTCGPCLEATQHARSILDAFGEPLYHVGDECPNCGSRDTITGKGGWLLDCRACGAVRGARGR